MTDGFQYPRAPITEAVIEVRFEKPFDPELQAELSQQFREDYPGETKFAHFAMQVSETIGQRPIDTGMRRYRRASNDQQEVLILAPNSIAVAQLAPYQGWDKFFERFERDWVHWKRRAGYQKITRIGVRYINRLDVPVQENGLIEEKDYLTVYPTYPVDFGPTHKYVMQLVHPIRDIECQMIIQTASDPSPIPNHVAIYLDIDISKGAGVPQRDDDLVALLGAIRQKKNHYFESCLTDKARTLFQ